MIFYLWVSRDTESCISGARHTPRGSGGGAGACTLTRQHAGQQLLGEEWVEGGCFVFSGSSWNLFAPGALLWSPVWGQCPDNGEGTWWHCRAQLQNACPGRFLHFPQGDAGLQYGAPLLSSQVSTGGPQHVTLTVPSHLLKQKQWPHPHPVPLGLLRGQELRSGGALSPRDAPLHLLLGLLPVMVLP